MNVRPSILCPVDSTEASAGALRYAAALAEHFATRLIVLGVDDPFSIASAGMGRSRRFDRAVPELSLFVAQTFADDAGALSMCEQDVALGKPAAEILRVARERSCDLIVMSAHGARDLRTFSLGSITERVLRETTVPVLVTPATDPGRIRVGDAVRRLLRMVVPVDLTSVSAHQAEVAAGLAGALAMPLVFLHVIEPVSRFWIARAGLSTASEQQQTADAENRLAALLATMPLGLDMASLIVRGDPAEEVARVVHDSRAGLVVMALHGNPACGPRMGSVTFQALCLTSALVLALPPQVRSVVYAPDPVVGHRARRAAGGAAAFM